MTDYQNIWRTLGFLAKSKLVLGRDIPVWIIILKSIVDIYLSKHKRLYCAFVDNAKAFDTVNRTGCENTIYNMVTAIVSGKLDLHRMPYPLLETNVSYFAGKRERIRKEYGSWLETMYAQLLYYMCNYKDF